MNDDDAKRPRKPAIRENDIVLADGSWFIVVAKHGQRLTGELLVNRNRHHFTTRSVDRVFREMGKQRV